MGRVPPFKRIGQEDFPGQRSWITSLLGPLNNFFSIMYENLNQGLTFNDNFRAFIKDVRVDASPTYPITFQNTMRVSPQGVIILKLEENVSNPSTVTSAVTLDWSFSEGSIKINNITGLDAAKTYSLRVLVIGG